MILSLLALMACQQQVPPEPAAQAEPAGRATHVFLQTDLELPAGTQATQERKLMQETLEAAQYAARVCYARAVERNPYTYGDQRVRVVLNPDGSVASVDTVFSTLNDDAMEACVLDIVRQSDFPAPSRDALTLSYPFVFTSDLTPPEISRALLAQYGLIDTDEETVQRDPTKSGPAAGEQGWWESW